MRKSLLPVLPLLFALAGCSASSFSAFSGSLADPSFPSEEGEGYYLASEVKPLQCFDAEIDVSTRQKAIGLYSPYGETRYAIPSTGEVPLLVIPVVFDSGASIDIERIEKAFFGVSSNTSYQSVSSYYHLSSGGRLLLRGEVAPESFRCPYTAEELSSYSGGTEAKRVLSSIYEQALSWYGERFPMSYTRFATYYGDEPIPVYFLYDAPYSTSSSSLLWAFSINSPAPVSWSSLYMMGEGKEPDPHTYIHEVGHLLGLPDYYDTTSSDLRISPLGRMDMMDCSVGDHNAFSKYLLGWGMPYVVTGECSITLNQATYNNQMVLLSPSWNQTPYDEYLLLEFYTPGILNGPDADKSRGDGARLPSYPGIKAYRVDARLALYENNRKGGILSPSTVLGESGLDFNSDNSLSSPYLIQLLDKSSDSASLSPYFVAGEKEESFSESGLSLTRSEALFYKGDGIGKGDYPDMGFSFGELSIGFEVRETTSSLATLDFFYL
ncbi:MAG: hypothetical protein IAC61_04290 [Firmicutes bacterium]|uniref:Peptidase M6-like domain-containing protein n=1 Tax=Candidatus Alloenteromonas pullistercoris TaxID=2840785 RepID=A0A9D9DGY6_9FIRM|nr:hypothetical protein [Candidatus Enteromonas pullistercoris]